MADSATSSLRLRDQETGGNDGQWGTYTDTNFALVEESVSGVLSKSVAGSADVTLTSTNFTSDESRHAVLEFTGALTGNINVIIPNVQKTYFLYNNTSGSYTLSIKTSSGTAVQIPQGSKEYVYCDGGNAIVTLLGTTHSTNVATVAGEITPTNNVATLAGIAANVTTVAGVSADVTTVATSVTAGHVAIVSGINAAVSSVSDNMPDVSTVAGDSANLQTVAGQISGTNNIAILADISSDISTVAGVSSAVSTVATNVADVTNFSDVYIGAASSAPSTRTDGSSLTTGDLYFNTSTDALNIYDGSNFQAAALSSSGFIAAVSSPTDNAVPRFNGTGGAAIQGSAVIIDDSNNMTGVASLALTTDLAVAHGGTGSSSASDARTALGVAIGSNVQAYDAQLADLAGLAVTDSNFIVGNGSNWVAETGATARTSLGVGSISTQASDSVSITGGSISGITDLAVADGGTGSSSASAARTALGVAVGSDVQAYDADLAAIAALAKTDSNFIVGNGSAWVAESGSTARASLGLDSMATQANDAVNIDGGSITGITDLAVADGGTGQGSYTNGQLLIGNSTGNTLAKGTLTAGAGISVTNAAGAITVANTSHGLGAMIALGVI
jgi:hypothetical protein